MSGLVVRRALQNRFESVRRDEIERLQKKLRGLTDHDRQSVERITVDVIQALARDADSALAEDMPEAALHALVQLFALDTDIH